MSIAQEISKNVFLTTKKMDTNAQDGCHTIYLYTVSLQVYFNFSQVEVKEVSIVEIVLDFSEGFNIQLENSNDLRAVAVIKPMSSDTVAVVRAYDETWANPCKIQ